jgi:hypothetical protein
MIRRIFHINSFNLSNCFKNDQIGSYGFNNQHKKSYTKYKNEYYHKFNENKFVRFRFASNGVKQFSSSKKIRN